jgi:Na+-driven multidrug efflux pump
MYLLLLNPVAAWGIIESIWDLFEAATNGLAEAGSIRLAFHLGRGDVEASKLSSSKTLFLSTCLSCMMSAGFLFLIPYLPHWFTKDNTLQNMVEALLPFVAIGNILMAYGMVSWSLVGAQGRFKLATSVSAIMTLCITLPLSAGFCLGFRFSLEALVGAIVIGYSTTGLVMGFILQMSDWEGISKSVQAQHEEDEEDSDDSISGSSSSSADEFVDDVSLTVLY